jgi:hypothetical protein
LQATRFASFWIKFSVRLKSNTINLKAARA